MSNINPIPDSAVPKFTPYSEKPTLPSAWEGVALLHPFSPRQENTSPRQANTPFFELCVANISYQAGSFFSAQVRGSSGRTWWYIIRPGETTVSYNQGPFETVDMGWSLPTTDWLDSTAACAGASPFNWMGAQDVSWWKMEVTIPNNPYPGTTAATWMWFDTQSKLPVRLMYGQAPVASTTVGDPNQLAFFQMFSFTYFPEFRSLPSASIPNNWVDPTFQGFSWGNPNGYELFTWNNNFGMTVFMTPVNAKYVPLPTEVLYRWASDTKYNATSDRSQKTTMSYMYNPGPKNPTAEVALLTGRAPHTKPTPAGSGTGYLFDYNNNNEVYQCKAGPDEFPFGEQAPDWVQTPAVEGRIQATISNNPVLCPGQTVTVLSVLFPSSQFPSNTAKPPHHYPDSTYLWTWYSPLNASGTSSRPVTFMQSQSGVNLGTSLSLADYFYYEEYQQIINPANFAIPLTCVLCSNTPLQFDFTVYSTRAWQSTDIVVAVGDNLSIEYQSGTWSAYPAAQGKYDANGYGPGPGSPTYQTGYTVIGYNMGGLCAFIGETPPAAGGGDAFFVGNNYSGTSSKSGRLWLCINDDLQGRYGAGLTDNSGFVVVKICKPS